MVSKRSDGGCNPRIEAAGIAERAHERHELDDHDQRAGRRLGKGEAAHHLARCQPPVDRDRLMGHVGEHSVGAAEGDQGGAREEQALVDEDAGAAEQHRDEDDGRDPQRQPDGEDQHAAVDGRLLSVKGVVADQRCQSIVNVAGFGLGQVGSPPAEQPADQGCGSDDCGKGTLKKVRARNEATARATNEGWVRPRLLTLSTACSTMAMTAGPRPRKRASTKLVSS